MIIVTIIIFSVTINYKYIINMFIRTVYILLLLLTLLKLLLLTL